MIEYKSLEKQAFTIFTINPHEISELIIKWCTLNGYTRNKTVTLQWISVGEETDPGDKLYNLPVEVLLKASQILEQNGKIQLIEVETNIYGIKLLG